MEEELVDVPLTDALQIYAVDLYRGESPLRLVDSSPGPTLTRAEVGDPDVIGVADPWLRIDGDTWFLFAEIIRERLGAPNDQQGVIGLATSRNAGQSWIYEGVVLEEEWHLSYPLIVEHEQTFYMIPESSREAKVVPYVADDYPRGWRKDSVLLTGKLADPTLFASGGRWWLFVTDSNERADDTLRLFSSERLSGPYAEHPASPVVVGDISKARSAGQVVDAPEGLLRFAQDNREGYGRAVRAFAIETLTTTEYSEVEIAMTPPIAGSGEGWNADGMHHLSPVRVGNGQWVSAVDGYHWERVFDFAR